MHISNHNNKSKIQPPTLEKNVIKTQYVVATVTLTSRGLHKLACGNKSRYVRQGKTVIVHL